MWQERMRVAQSAARQAAAAIADRDAIAKALGIPSATVRTRMHRARKKLAEVLQPDFRESSYLEVSGRVQPCEP